jgi:predicted nucleic acid-binding protein
MSINEMIWVLKRSEYDRKVMSDKIEFVFSLPLRFLAPNQDIFLESVRIMEMYNVGFSDSVIAAHAVIAKLKIATLDRDFEKISEIEVFGIE